MLNILSLKKVRHHLVSTMGISMDLMAVDPLTKALGKVFKRHVASMGLVELLLDRQTLIL